MLFLMTSMVSLRVASGKVQAGTSLGQPRGGRGSHQRESSTVLLFENSQSSHGKVLPTIAKKEGKLGKLSKARRHVRSRSKAQVYALGIRGGVQGAHESGRR